MVTGVCRSPNQLSMVKKYSTFLNRTVTLSFQVFMLSLNTTIVRAFSCQHFAETKRLRLHTYRMIFSILQELWIINVYLGHVNLLFLDSRLSQRILVYANRLWILLNLSVVSCMCLCVCVCIGSNALRVWERFKKTAAVIPQDDLKQAKQPW